MSEIDKEFVFKVVLMGDGSVGKTSIRSKFMGVGFKSEYIKTIGADFASKAIVLGTNKVHFQIWDLAGQKMYKHVRSSFYSGCKCGFLVFDLTQPETLESLETWVEEAIEHSGGYLKIFIILGNKHDLVDEIKIKDGEVNRLLKKLQAMEDIEAAYLKTSALTGENINEAFEMMGKMFLEKEGFPRLGAEGVLVEQKAQENPKVDRINLPEAPLDELEADENSSEKLNSVIAALFERIKRLSEIITSLEERMILLETKKLSKDEAKELETLREKIESIDEEMVSLTGYATAQEENNEIDLDVMIPVPTMEDLDIEGVEEEKDFEKIDRSSLETMVVIDEENDEESITELLKEEEEKTFKEVETTEKKKKSLPTKCPKCGTKLSFIKQYNRWYCYRCKIYV